MANIRSVRRGARNGADRMPIARQKIPRSSSRDQKKSASQRVHASDFAGHFGVRRTRSVPKQVAKVSWGGMSADVYDSIQSCDECLKRSSAYLKCAHPMRPIPHPKHLMRRVGEDIIKMPNRRSGRLRQVYVCSDFEFPRSRARCRFSLWGDFSLRRLCA